MTQLTYQEYWNNIQNHTYVFKSESGTNELPWDIETFDLALKETLDYYHLNEGKVLELGCGFGYDSAYLCKRGFDVTAVDISDYSISVAKQKNKELNIKFIVGDFFEDLQLEKYNLVYDRGFLHNYKNNIPKIFELINNVLLVGGKVIIITGNPNQPQMKTTLPPPITISEIELNSFKWFKIIMVKEVLFKLNKHFNDGLGYLFVLEKK